MNGNGNFGNWFFDKHGLPAYNYACNQYSDPQATTSTTHGLSIDHFHQIGNDQITATVHNGGHVQVLDSSRGFQWLTYRDEKRKKIGGGIALFNIGSSDKVWTDSYDSKNAEKISGFQRIFGMGYFQKKLNLENLKVVHDICAPFSGDPVIISEIEVTNKSNGPINDIKLIDTWDIYLHHILKSLVVTSSNRRLFGITRLMNWAGKLLKFLQKITRTDTEGSRRRFDKKFKFTYELNDENNTLILTPKYRKRIPVSSNEPAKHDFYPKTIFLSMIIGDALKLFTHRDQLFKNDQAAFHWEDEEFKKKGSIVKNPCLGIGTEFSLKSKESKRITCVFGYADSDEIENLILKYQGIAKQCSITKYNALKWKKSLIEFDLEKDSWLNREVMWHSYYTRSACYFDEYFNQHIFPQGSIYQFGHGFDGAIRDYVLFLNSIIFISPRLAKEYLTYIVSLISPNGDLPYTRYGFVKILSPAVHSNPSDLHLFYLWGIVQYVYTTRDFDFLNEELDFYPKSSGKKSTVQEKIYIALKYLFSEKIGLGEHGLIKFNDGDWSDGISLLVDNRKKFKKYGESNFNSAMALYIIPEIVPLIMLDNPDLATLCEKKFDELKKAVLKTWNGKWFYRGWDGNGKPIGDDSIYLEHHAWLLISEILDRDRALSVISEIYNKLDKPSPIGQYISYPPQVTKFQVLPEGWDVNGGIWHAMNALLTWGYSKYDTEKA